MKSLNTALSKLSNSTEIVDEENIYGDESEDFNEYDSGDHSEDYDFSQRSDLGDLPYQDTIIDSGDDDTLEKPDLANKVYFADDTDSNAFCEPYRGRICRHLIGSRMIYVTSATQQENTERLLASAGSDFDHRQSSTAISFNPTGSMLAARDPCKEATMFLACINAFPLCDESVHPVPLLKRPRVDNWYKNSKSSRAKLPSPPSSLLSNPFKRMKIPTCTELPPSSSHADCLSLSELRHLGPKINHHCYNSTTEYLGVISQSQSGRPCLPWNSVVSSNKPEVAHLSYIFHPELGNHQYCRNPIHSFPFSYGHHPRDGLDERKPWCFVDSGFGERNPIAEPCTIPKCSAVSGTGAGSSIAGIRSELWMVILPSIMVPAGLALLLLFMYLLCCKKWRNPVQKKKSNNSKRSLVGSTKRQTSFGTTFLSNHPPDECSELLENRRYPSQGTSMGSTGPSYLRDPMVFPDRMLARPSPPVIASAVIRPTISSCLANRRSRHPMTDNCNSPLQSVGNSLSHPPNADDLGSNGCKEIPYHHIRFLFELGQGRYGPCFIGEIMPTPSKSQRCLIKTLKDSNRLDQFLADSGALTSSPVRHPHLCNLLGFCSDPPATLFDHLPFDLNELISDGDSTTVELFPLLIQVASAMTYLSGRQMVHKDIAARNVLVDESRQSAKLSFDIGRCRSQYMRDYYRISAPMSSASASPSLQLLPIRWMAPEAVVSGISTTQSDVWSFGVLIWELYSRGERPYDGHTNPEVIERLRDRNLLKAPATQSPHIRALMFECWYESPCDRPTFAEILAALKGARLHSETTPTEEVSPFSDTKNTAANAVLHFKV
ncbi:hypothetical protein ACOME3_003218 [Neoechinorhynchus agilis]